MTFQRWLVGRPPTFLPVSSRLATSWLLRSVAQVKLQIIYLRKPRGQKILEYLITTPSGTGKSRSSRKTWGQRKTKKTIPSYNNILYHPCRVVRFVRLGLGPCPVLVGRLGDPLLEIKRNDSREDGGNVCVCRYGRRWARTGAGGCMRLWACCYNHHQQRVVYYCGVRQQEEREQQEPAAVPDLHKPSPSAHPISCSGAAPKGWEANNFLILCVMNIQNTIPIMHRWSTIEKLQQK